MICHCLKKLPFLLYFTRRRARPRSSHCLIASTHVRPGCESFAKHRVLQDILPLQIPVKLSRVLRLLMQIPDKQNRVLRLLMQIPDKQNRVLRGLKKLYRASPWRIIFPITNDDSPSRVRVTFHSP